MPEEGYSRSSTGPKIHGLKKKPAAKKNIFTKAVEREQAKRTRTAKLADAVRKNDG